MGPNWEESPHLLKPCGDRAFCQGLNRNVLCFYVHQADDNARPGYQWEAAGTHFDRHVTWWPQSGAWLTYLARCQFLLQQGLPVADVCYYYGQDVPAHVPYREKLNPAMPSGYDYDVCNTEVLCSRMSVRGGRVVLPDGVGYEVLVLPERDAMTPKVLTNVAALAAAGATVLGPKPGRSPSLQDYPRCDHEVKRLADALWGASKVISGKTVEQVLHGKDVAPEFEASDPLSYVHRTSAEGEIFFVSNQRDQPVQAECTFRVAGRQPELWDPVTGEIKQALAFRQHVRRTTLPLELAPGDRSSSCSALPARSLGPRGGISPGSGGSWKSRARGRSGSIPNGVVPSRSCSTGSATGPCDRGRYQALFRHGQVSQAVRSG